MWRMLVYHASTRGKNRPASALVLPSQLQTFKPQQQPLRAALASPTEEIDPMDMEIDPLDTDSMVTDEVVVMNTAQLQKCKKLPSPKRIAVRPVSTSWVS